MPLKQITTVAIGMALAFSSTAAVAAGPSPLNARPVAQKAMPQPASETVTGRAARPSNEELILILIAAGASAVAIERVLNNRPDSPGQNGN